jgi:hypothetical protein
MVPCGPNQSASILVCQNFARGSNGACPSANPYLTRGTLNRNDSATFGGTPGIVYDVTVHVRGIVEPKHFTDGTKDTAHEGWYVGGTPSTAGGYNVYMLGVSDPPQSYYLNALNKSEAHFTYPIDYEVTFPVAGGATLTFLASDSNCSTVRNCDPTSIDGYPVSGQCNANLVPDLPPAAGIVQPYNGQFIYMNVVSVAARP